VEKLDQVGATILGIVLNKVTRHTGRNYGYGYSYTDKPYQYSYKPGHAGTEPVTQGGHLNGAERPGSQFELIPWGGISKISVHRRDHVGGIGSLMSGEFTNLVAVATCGAVVAAAEAVTIPLLRRAAIIDVPSHRSSHTIPTPRAAASRSSPGCSWRAG